MMPKKIDGRDPLAFDYAIAVPPPTKPLAPSAFDAAVAARRADMRALSGSFVRHAQALLGKLEERPFFYERLRRKKEWEEGKEFARVIASAHVAAKS